MFTYHNITQLQTRCVEYFSQKSHVNESQKRDSDLWYPKDPKKDKGNLFQYTKGHFKFN